MKDTKNKLVGATVILIIGIIAGWFGAKKYYTPTPPDPDKPSVIKIIKGEPGAITVVNELFYHDYFSALITATGKAQAEYTVKRPDRWYDKTMHHFIGVGISADICNNGLLYGGFVQYRYLIWNNISSLVQINVSASGPAYNAGIKLGMELGVK